MRSLLLRRKVRITTVVAEVAIVERSLGRIVRFVSVSVRRVSAGGARGATGEGVAGAASGEIAGVSEAVCSQAFSSDADGYHSVSDSHDSDNHRRRRSRRGMRRYSPSRHHHHRSPQRSHREGHGGTSSFLSSKNVSALNNVISEHTAKAES